MSDSKEKDWSRSRSAREPRGEPLQRKGGSGVFRPSTAYASSTCKQTKAPRSHSLTNGSGPPRYSPGSRSTTPNARLSPSPSLTSCHKVSREWSGVSYLQDCQGHGMLSTAMDNGYRDYIVPPSSMIRGLPSQLGSLPPTPSFTNSSDRNWHTATFPATQMMPSGRGEVSKLRTWLENELSNLSLNTSAELYEFSETALSLYNLSFQEITRQVSVNCVERGRLMADLWTSNAELTGRLLTDLINQKDASERAMMAMQQDNQELQNELDSLRMKLKHKEAEQQEASRRLKALEGLAVKYKYRGESWEEQEAEWQKLEEVRAKERENYKPEARAGGSDGGKPGSFFMSARLKAMKADEG